jgi:hypothetical protein
VAEEGKIMKVGDLYPVATKTESGLFEVEGFIIKDLIKKREVKIRKDNQCCICGKDIPKGTLCLFANTILQHPNHCPTLFANLWWHTECDNVSYEEIKRLTEEKLSCK